MKANVNEKILNALNMYNSGLQTKISDTYVAQVSGKDLSTNDFTDALKTKLEGLSAVNTANFVEKDGDKVLSTNDFTNAYKSAIDGLSNTYATKSEVASVLIYKGTVANFAAIASDTSIAEGWVYNISVGGGVDEKGIPIKDGDNVAKTATGFDVLAGSVDTSNFVEKDGDKVLSTNDFTNADKAKLDSLSTTAEVNLDGYMKFYIGSVAPTDTSVIWFDTSAYSN